MSTYAAVGLVADVESCDSLSPRALADVVRPEEAVPPFQGSLGLRHDRQGLLELVMELGVMRLVLLLVVGMVGLQLVMMLRVVVVHGVRRVKGRMRGMQVGHGLQMRVVSLKGCVLRVGGKVQRRHRTRTDGGGPRGRRGRWLRLLGRLAEPIAQDVADREGDAGGGLLRLLLRLLLLKSRLRGEIGTTSGISSRLGELVALATVVIAVVRECLDVGLAAAVAVAIVTVVVLAGLWLLWWFAGCIYSAV
uniref:Uncharacterized protein n=1 Tax=Anopheles atroparvus TaxID=41427 RepID=A0A182IJM3_ANOAO